MADRFYRINGKRVPSVTTITGQLDKPALVYWAANCAVDYVIQEMEEVKRSFEGYSIEDLYPILESARKNFRKVSQQALDIGSGVHGAIEYHLKTGKEPLSPSDELLSAFLAFLEWKDAHNMEPLKLEHTLYDPQKRYAGTCDLICKLDGKTYLVDFKTSKKPRGKPYPEWGYQTAAYRACYEGIQGNGILRLDKETGMPDWYDLSEAYEQDLKAFNHLADFWWATHPNHQ